jgi:hypothetical protein
MWTATVLKVLEKKIQGHQEGLALGMLCALKHYVETGYKLSDIEWFKNLHLEKFEEIEEEIEEEIA